MKLKSEKLKEKLETKLKETEKNLMGKLKKREEDQEYERKRRTGNLDKDSHRHSSQRLGPAAKEFARLGNHRERVSRVFFYK
ncbi:hypothetical protein EV1_044095 [Malus domestica]